MTCTLASCWPITAWRMLKGRSTNRKDQYRGRSSVADGTCDALSWLYLVANGPGSLDDQAAWHLDADTASKHEGVCLVRGRKTARSATSARLPVAGGRTQAVGGWRATERPIGAGRPPVRFTPEQR